MNHAFRHFVFSLLIAAFVTMGVSPACEFISSGQNTIELCNELGETQEITLAEAGLNPSQNEHNHKVEEPCMFCFSYAHGHSIVPSDTAKALPLLAGAYLKTGSGLYVPRSLEHAPFNPRAPPTPVV